MWEEGAILSDKLEGEGDGYKSIEDIWNHVELKSEYISRHIVENVNNYDFFERVYSVEGFRGMVYKTKEEMKKMLEGGFAGK